MSDLGTLAGWGNSQAYAINDLGEVVGNSTVANGWNHAFLWENGAMTDLDGGQNITSIAYGINNLGQVVGLADFNGPAGAFLWQSDSGMENLNDLIVPGSGWTLDEAHAINGLGQIVGSGEIDGQYHAFLLTPESSTVPEPSTLVAWCGLGAMGLIAAWRRRRKAKA
jgi:probable HAF family extracellular repeat protein